MDTFNLDLSLVARLCGHSAPRTHRVKERFPGMTITCALIQMVVKAAGETGKAKIITKARVTELIMTDGACTGCVHEKGEATFKEFGPVIFASGGFQRGFHQQLTACTVPPSQPLEQLTGVLEKPKDRFFCIPDRTQYRIRSPRLAASFQMVLTRCEFCPVALNVKVMKLKQEPFSSNCFSPVFRHGKWQAVVGRHGSSSEGLDEHWIATASDRSADGRRAADAAQLECPLEEGPHLRQAQQSPWCSHEADRRNEALGL